MTLPVSQDYYTWRAVFHSVIHVSQGKFNARHASTCSKGMHAVPIYYQQRENSNCDPEDDHMLLYLQTVRRKKKRRKYRLKDTNDSIKICKYSWWQTKGFNIFYFVTHFGSALQEKNSGSNAPSFGFVSTQLRRWRWRPVWPLLYYLHSHWEQPPDELLLKQHFRHRMRVGKCSSAWGTNKGICRLL